MVSCMEQWAQLIAKPFCTIGDMEGKNAVPKSALLKYGLWDSTAESPGELALKCRSPRPQMRFRESEPWGRAWDLHLAHLPWGFLAQGEVWESLNKIMALRFRPGHTRSGGDWPGPWPSPFPLGFLRCPGRQYYWFWHFWMFSHRKRILTYYRNKL